MDIYSTHWLISYKGFCIISLMCCMWLCVQPSSWYNCCSSEFWLLSLVHILVCYGLIFLVSSFLNELSFYPQSFDQTILVLQVESLFMELQHVCAACAFRCVALTQLWAPELHFMKHIHLFCEVKWSNLPEKLQIQLCNGLIRPEGVWWFLWVPGCCLIFVFGNNADINIGPRVNMPRCRSCAFRLATSLIFHILPFLLLFLNSSQVFLNSLVSLGRISLFISRKIHVTHMNAIIKREGSAMDPLLKGTIEVFPAQSHIDRAPP